MSDHKAGAGWARAAGVAAPRPPAPAPRAHGRMDGRMDRRQLRPPPLLTTSRLLTALFSYSGYGCFSPALLPSLCPLLHFDTGDADAWPLAAGAALFAGQLCPVKPAADAK